MPFAAETLLRLMRAYERTNRASLLRALAPSCYGLALNDTLTQYSGFGGGENEAFSSFGRTQASFAFSGTTITWCTDPLLSICKTSSVGAGPAPVAHSFTACA